MHFSSLVKFNADRFEDGCNSITFPSSSIGKNAPVYGTQWHPEKNCFEWTPKEVGPRQAMVQDQFAFSSHAHLRHPTSVPQDIPHSSDAIEVCHSMAFFFVNEARKNNHSYDYNDLMKVWRKENSVLRFTFEPSCTQEPFLIRAFHRIHLQHIIYNYNPIFSGLTGSGFEQVYIF